VKRIILIDIAGPLSFLVCYLIGSTYHFDGQAAIISFPFVLMGWGFTAYAIAVNGLKLLQRSERPKIRIWSFATLFVYGLLLYLMIPKNR
jgi:hypothetical protein